MSRYAILTEDENLEVFTGFEEGMDWFFLTIADARTSTGEAGTYLFHNYDHHPTLGMTLDEVATTLNRFGMTMPSDLLQRLLEDAKRCGMMKPKVSSAASTFTRHARPAPGPAANQASSSSTIRVLRWQSAL